MYEDLKYNSDTNRLQCRKDNKTVINADLPTIFFGDVNGNKGRFYAFLYICQNRAFMFGLDSRRYFERFFYSYPIYNHELFLSLCVYNHQL